MQTSVSGSMRASVSGTPSSLLWLRCAATTRRWGASSARSASFVDVLPAEPATPTMAASLAGAPDASAPAAPRARRAPRARPSRPAPAPAPARTAPRRHRARRPPRGSRARRRARPAARRRGRRPARSASRSRPRGPGSTGSPATSVAPSISRAASGITSRSGGARARPTRSSNGCTTPATSCPCSWPLPQITTTSPGPASASASAIAARRSGSTVTRAGSFEARDDLAEDRQRILRTRVVARHVDAVGAGLGRGAHQGPLRPVAIAAGPEHADHAAARGGARAAQHRLDAGRGVRVVDDHGERLVGIDGLEAAGRRRDGRGARDDRVVGQVGEQRERDRAEQVLDVEAAPQRALDLERSARGLDLERDAAAGRARRVAPRRPRACRRRSGARPAASCPPDRRR